MIQRSAILCLALLAGWQVAAGNEPLQIAERQFDAGNYQDAVATLQAALAQQPQDPRLYHWLSRCFLELSDYERAVADAERAVKLEPRNAEYHLWLGRAYGRKADRARSFWLARKVRREFEESVRLDPANIEARSDLLEFYTEAPGIVGGGKEKAREQAEAIAALDPLEGHLARAAYWLSEKKPEQAEAEYRHVLEAKPARAGPYLDVADFYGQREDAARMERAVEAAALADSADPRLLYYRGVVRVLAGNRLSEAEHFLKSYLATVPKRSDRPSHAAAREWLGRLYERLGKAQEAAAQYRTALQLDPSRKGLREGLRRTEKPL
jgi:tetratricopeptide (TPR) repeat protein